MRFIIAGGFTDGNGSVVSGGTVTVYLAGTTTPATIYSASSGGSAISGSAVTSDDFGYWSCYVDNADYIYSQKFKLVLSKTGYTTKEYDDRVAFVNSGLASVETIAHLRSLAITENNLAVQVKGYYVQGDGGGGPIRISFFGAAAGTYVDNGGSIIVPTGGDGSAAWLLNYAGEINGKWFGMVADYSGGTGTNNKTAFDRAVTATPIGGVLKIPNGQYYFSASPAAITKYITLKGDGLSGYYASGLIFDACSGIDVETGYFTITDIAIWGVTQAAVNVDPGASTIGLRIGSTEASPVHPTIQNVQIGYFNTGLYCGTNNAVYAKVSNLDVFYNNTGIVGYNIALDSTWDQVHVRASAVYGLYAYNSWMRFTNSLFELNGTAPSNLDGDANANYYGVRVSNNSQVDLSDVYFEFNTAFVGAGSTLRVNKTTGSSFAIFGAGKLVIEDDVTSKNLVPESILTDWTVTNATPSLYTVGGLSYKVVSTSATGCQILYRIPSSRKITPQDITGALFEFDLKVATGSGVAGFAVTPGVTFHQPSGRQDGINAYRWRKSSEFVYSNATEVRQSLYVKPRFGDSPLLDSAEYGMDYIDVIITISGDFSGATSLTAYLRNVSFQLFTRTPISEPVYSENTWTPTDGSGAGLALTSVSGTWTKVGRLVTAAFTVTYPATADGSAAIIGGLPFAVASSSGYGGHLTYTNSSAYYSLQATGTTLIFRKTDGTAPLNSALSTKIFSSVVHYITNQ